LKKKHQKMEGDCTEDQASAQDSWMLSGNTTSRDGARIEEGGHSHIDDDDDAGVT
jgi:hypothetical protein